MGTRHDLYFMLHLPAAVAQAIWCLQRKLDASYRGPSKPMAPDRLHTTLVPLGSYGQRIPLDVLRVTQSAGALLSEAPFRVAFGHCGGPVGQTRARIGGTRGDTATEYARCARLHRQLADALRQMGWPEAWLRRSFYPHITLDYWHAPVGVRRVEPFAWDVTEFELVDSHYGEGRHEVLARWPLLNRQASLFD